MEFQKHIREVWDQSECAPTQTTQDSSALQAASPDLWSDSSGQEEMGKRQRARRRASRT